MAEELRSLVSEKLTVVGMQLQDLWQEACASGQLLKGALSSLPSHHAFNLPTKANDGSSQPTILPLFNLPGIHSSSSAHGYLVPPDMEHGQPQPESPTLSVPSSLGTDSTTPSYVDASSQTVPSPQSSPPTDNEDYQSESETGVTPFAAEKESRVDEGSGVKINDMPSDQSNGDGSDVDAAPEVFDGPSRVVVSKLDGQDYPAILITKEMIKRLEDISLESDRLEHFEPQFEEADRTFEINRINLEYCESRLEDAKSQEEIDELREDIAQRRNTFSEDKKRRDDLEEQVVRLRRNERYMEGLFTEMFQKVLANAGLVKFNKEDIEQNGNAEDGADSEATDSIDDYQYPSYHSDYSSVSIDELARRAANEEVRQRHIDFCAIEHEFDTRQQLYDMQNARLQQLIREGTAPMTQTEFDHADFEATRALTADLREAEDRLEEAMARRNRFGPNEEDQESDFVDDEYDGYPLSWENDGVVAAPTALINQWLEGIPDAENIPDMAELEEDFSNKFGQLVHDQVEDCDIRSARMSDAWSCRDWTRNRRRIDRWRAIAGRER